MKKPVMKDTVVRSFCLPAAMDFELACAAAGRSQSVSDFLRENLELILRVHRSDGDVGIEDV